MATEKLYCTKTSELQLFDKCCFYYCCCYYCYRTCYTSYCASRNNKCAEILFHNQHKTNEQTEQKQQQQEQRRHQLYSPSSSSSSSSSSSITTYKKQCYNIRDKNQSMEYKNKSHKFQKHRWKCDCEQYSYDKSNSYTNDIIKYEKQGYNGNEWLDNTNININNNVNAVNNENIITIKHKNNKENNNTKSIQNKVFTNCFSNGNIADEKIIRHNQIFFQQHRQTFQNDSNTKATQIKEANCCCSYNHSSYINSSLPPTKSSTLSNKCSSISINYDCKNVNQWHEQIHKNYYHNNNNYNKCEINVLYNWRSIKMSIENYQHDLYKLLRVIISILLFFNMLPLFYAVASDNDASVVGGPNADPHHSWIPVVAYLEPLPRPTKAPKCDQTFVSRAGGIQNGTFTAPLLHNPTNHSRQCLYIFLAGPGQRVEVLFTTFNLRGNPPDGAAVGEIPACSAEYMDIYAEVQSSDPADLINSPFGGRYCGPIPPRRRISLYRAVALSFFTSKNSTTPDIFGGRYTFINASVFEIGTPVSGSPCSYTITPHKNKSDIFISPTYPGAYPKDMSCTYQFIGESSQRVRLEFRDFDLFFGGPHCPFDYVKVYDGPDNSSALIGTYCGQQRNLVLYSSESSLLVHFFTLQRTAHTQNRGFKGIYEFSEGFVKLDFIRENSGMHIRGSECDQKILSKKESSGMVYSPNYPYPYLPKTVCRYFVYGMQDAQHLERVRLKFDMFQIQKGEHKDKDKESNCTDSYLKIYLKGQETQDAYDKFDYELCGYDTPTALVSDGPRLAMVFSSGELQAGGFKAKYTFETEYKIPGTAAPDGSCTFTYRSTSRKKGEFNSPRYPSNYPSDTNCSYHFLATPNEQVTIVFDHFKVKTDNANITEGAYGLSECFQDWLEMYVTFRDGSDRFLGRYCGFTAPGPVESPRGSVGIRIVLHTDHENVASGFKARYIFEVAKSVYGDCGGNYSGQDSGIITSPNYPLKYDGPGKGVASRACNWYLSSRNGYRISMNFEHFFVEGDPAGRGCPAAVLRIWINPDSEQAPIELCGEKPILEYWHYVSIGQSARISFTTTDKTIGAAGFRIIWNEIQIVPPSSIQHYCESSYLFRCEITGFCITDKLRCDGTKNCGPGDDTDEMHCTMIAVEEGYGTTIIIIIIGATAGLFLICLLYTVCHCKRKRRLHRQLGLHRNAAHYDSTTSATGLSSSRRHLQGGNSLSGSLRGINSDLLTIPPAPLPPTSVPPHICITNDLLDDDDDDDDDEDVDDDDDDDDDDVEEDEDDENCTNHNELFINADRFSSGDSV